MDNTILNTIHVYYFSTDNLENQQEGKLRLINIQNSQTSPTETYSELKITNIA
jgi:hypothetical protein